MQTADMLKLPRPDLEGGKAYGKAAPASIDLKEFVTTLAKRASDVAIWGVDNNPGGG